MTVGVPPYEVQLRNLDRLPLAVVRREARPSELSRLVPECCGIVWNGLKAQYVKGGRNVAIYSDRADGVIALECGVEVAGRFVESAEIVRSSTPGGRAASVTHLGPYSELGIAHQAIQDWAKANGHQLAGPRWEIYGHWQPDWNDNPSRIRTDVFYLIAP
jgi:effector-binding domain-containing protein